MNFNKYTKAELISKFKKLESKNDSTNINNSFLNTIKSHFTQIWKLILTFKEILIKLTLISFFVQIFKKYRIFRRLWSILNTTVMALFGLSLIENFGIEYVQHLFNEIRFITWNIVDYLSNTHFYQYLNKLFSLNDDDDPSSEVYKDTGKIESMIRESNEQTTRNETKTSENIRPSDRYSKISEWLKPDIENNEEIQEVNGYNKYYIIAGITTLIILSSLAWTHSDDIRTFIDWLMTFRPGTSNDGASDNDSNRTFNSTSTARPINPPSPSLSSRIDEIELEDKTRVLTSPSLEDLNDKTIEAWGNPSSPSGSTSSIETIKPSDLTLIDIAILNKVNKEWKELIPDLTKQKISWIENNLNHINNFIIKKQMVEYLADIEIENCNLIKRIKMVEGRLNEIELAELELVKNKLDNWISLNHDKIFEK